MAQSRIVQKTKAKSAKGAVESLRVAARRRVSAATTAKRPVGAKAEENRPKGLKVAQDRNREKTLERRVTRNAGTLSSRNFDVSKDTLYSKLSEWEKVTRVCFCPSATR